MATLNGTLQAIGGPSPDPRPLSGTIFVVGSNGSYNAAVGLDGHFTLQVAPGTYTVTARTSGSLDCRAANTAAAAVGQTTTVEVDCDVK
jgi:hypothetical protein